MISRSRSFADDGKGRYRKVWRTGWTVSTARRQLRLSKRYMSVCIQIGCATGSSCDESGIADPPVALLIQKHLVLSHANFSKDVT